jgi:hypothetical protein
VLDRLEAGAALTATDYLEAQQARERVRVETAWAIDGVDALITPATPIVAPPLDADTLDVDGRPVPVRPALLSFTLPLSQLGTPVVAIPLGPSAGLPSASRSRSGPAPSDPSSPSAPPTGTPPASASPKRAPRLSASFHQAV